VSRDPVAADAVGARIIEQKRREMNLPGLKTAGREPTHIRTAEAIGVGYAAEDRISLVQI
jgi:hypothetical protein